MDQVRWSIRSGVYNNFSRFQAYVVIKINNAVFMVAVSIQGNNLINIRFNVTMYVLLRLSPVYLICLLTLIY